MGRARLRGATAPTRSQTQTKGEERNESERRPSLGAVCLRIAPPKNCTKLLFCSAQKKAGASTATGQALQEPFFETVLLGAPLIDSSAVNYTKYEFCVRSHGDRAKRVAEHNRICGSLPVRRAPCGAIMQTLRAVLSRRSASTRGATEATGGEAVRRDVARAEPKRAGRAGAHQRRASARASQRLWRTFPLPYT